MDRIDRFEILGEVGRGGMGTVYKARDPRINRVVAIKLLNEGFDKPEMRERFLQEARAAGGLQNPHIVTVFELGDYSGKPYIAMEYLVGEPLLEIIRRRAELTLRTRLQLVEDLCSGLASAHRAGIVHRDIKPANLMVLQEGGLKILDFGIARVGESELTQTGMVVGTLNYMSPEQCEGTELDKRSDIFAVGAVFYEMLTFAKAFPGRSYREVIPRIQTSEPVPLSVACPYLDPEIQSIVSKALRKDPARRYQDVMQLRRDIGKFRDRLEREEPNTLETTSTIVIAAPPSPAASAASREETVRRALAEVDTARKMFDRGERDQAILRLARFAPPNELVDEALDTLRRLAEEHEREQRQKAAIDRGLQAAQDALERREFESARRFADEVLRLDSTNAAAQRLLGRARAALEEQARQQALRQKIQDTLQEARRLFKSGDQRGALALLENFQPPQPEITAELAKLRAEFAEQTRREREAARRREADELEARGRRELGLNDAEAALFSAQEALRLVPGHPGATALAKEAERLLEEIRQREEHDRAALELVERARQQFDAGERAEALQALSAFKPPHALVNEMAATLRNELAEVERREQERARREDEERERERRAQAIEDERRRQAEDERRRAEADETLRLAWDALGAERFDEALQHAESALALQPDLEKASQVRDEAAAALDVEQRTRSAVAEARLEFSAGRYRSAITQLDAFTPRHPVVTEALASLRQDILEKLLERAGAALVDDRTSDALNAVAEAEELCGRSSRLDDVRMRIQTREGELQQLTLILDESTVALERRDFASAEQRLEEARRIKPDDQLISTLGARISSAVEEQRALDATVRAAIGNAEQAVAAGRFDEAISALASVVTRGGVSEEMAHASALLDEIRRTKAAADAEAARKAEQQRKEAEERRQQQEAAARATVAQARQAFDAGRHDEALRLLRESPSHPLTETAINELQRKRAAIEEQRRRDEIQRWRRARIAAAKGVVSGALHDRRFQAAAGVILAIGLSVAVWRSWPKSPVDPVPPTNGDRVGNVAPAGNPSGSGGGSGSEPPTGSAPTATANSSPAPGPSANSSSASNVRGNRGKPGGGPPGSGTSQNAPAGAATVNTSAPRGGRESSVPANETRGPGGVGPGPIDSGSRGGPVGSPPASDVSSTNPPPGVAPGGEPGAGGSTTAANPTSKPSPTEPITPPPPSPPVSSAGQERARIQLVLDQYEAAYSRTDEAALRRIDPNFKSIPNRGLLRSVKLTLSPRDIVVDDDLQSATVTATTNFVYEWNRAGLDRTSSGVLRWKLRKSGSEWTVVR